MHLSCGQAYQNRKLPFGKSVGHDHSEDVILLSIERAYQHVHKNVTLKGIIIVYIIALKTKDEKDAKENIQFFHSNDTKHWFSVFECGNGIYGTKQTDNSHSDR